MNTQPPAELSLDDIEQTAVAAGSPRIVILVALAVCLVLGIVTWGMYRSHRKRVEAAATVPSVMNTQAARPAESNRSAEERIDPPVKKGTVTLPAPTTTIPGTTPEVTSSAGGPVIRYQPDGAMGTSGTGMTADPAAKDPEAEEQTFILEGRKASLAVSFGTGAAVGQSNPALPNSATVPAIPSPGTPNPASAESAASLLLRSYKAALSPETSPAGSVPPQTAFIKNDDTALVGRSAPLPPYSLIKGTRIPAILDKNASSQLPGQIEAHVSEDVYNTRCGHSGSGCYVVIPVGSRLVGEYNPAVGYGQNRLQIAWTKLYFPDTSSIDLGRMAGYSNDGSAGVKAKTDNHWKRLLGGALLTTALNVGFSISQSRNQSAGYYPSPGNAAAAGVGTGLTQLGQDLTQQNLKIPPYLRAFVGTPISVDTNRDIIFEGPYQPLR